MNEARSIKQNPLADVLPNFRSLGVTLRILLIGNGMALIQALILAGSWGELADRLMDVATLFTPVLLSCLLLLWALQPWLSKLPYRQGAFATGALVVAVALAVYSLVGGLYHLRERGVDGFGALRVALLAMAGCLLAVMYFRWRSQVLSLALHDARLQVLRARIRPHFLFNTLNAVLSIVRARPDRAEAALEDMSDLFRMAMTEEHDLVPLRHEIELARQYVALEQLRLGERLHVAWRLDGLPGDALIPPLLLQPLLENAVYHGIEPLPQGGTIVVELRGDGRELRLRVENPSRERAGERHSGNRMALRNIRERLELLFDVEANYRVDRDDNSYGVEIVLPYLKEDTLGNR